MTPDSENSSLFQLVYVSAATVSFSDDALEQLLEGARHCNASLDITGVLLFKDGTFFQVLEGAPDAVQSLYEKIEQDRRHNNVLLLAKSGIEERNFGDWSMGFVRDQTEVATLPGFIDFFGRNAADRTFIDLYGDSQRVGTIIDGFRRGRWRRQAIESAA